VREERQVTNPGTVAPGDSAEVVSTFNPGWRAVQLAYLVFGVIDGLLLIRLVLKLLGANPRAGFSNWIYSVTDIFLGPFKNLLPTVGNEQSLLELSTVVAILVYALIGWAVARLFAIIFYRNVTVRRRSDLRPRGY
jgi:uncharacterized protein YggT (Ycf19 family)